MLNSSTYHCCVTSHLKTQQHETTADPVCQELGQDTVGMAFLYSTTSGVSAGKPEGWRAG